VVADRAGHALHTALVSRILRDHSLWEEVSAEEVLKEARATRPEKEEGTAPAVP
jgi:UDP-3-O-[3-hydroxymyristoyl] N-acetylglucosamine deacetylase